MSDELPPGWASVKIGDVAHFVRGVTYSKQHSSKEPDDGLVPVLRANNIGVGLIFDDLVYVPERFVSPEQIVRTGDVVLAMSSGSKSVVGKAAVANSPPRCGFGAFCGVIRPSKDVSHSLLGYYFQTKAYRNAVSEASKGVNINNLKAEHILDRPLPLPPQAEQERIASKVDELFSRIDEGERALERVSTLVERYRQSVLKAAITGELTRDWREARKAAGHPVESGEALLTRILTARREAWEQAELAKMKAKGIKPANDDWKKKYKEPLPPDTAELSELPDGWTWASVGQVAADTLVGLDRGSAEQRAEKSGCPYIKMNNVTMRGEVLYGDVVYVTATAEEKRKFTLRAGDILFNTRNSKELVGKAGLVVSPPSESLYNNNLMRIRSIPLVDSRYLVAQMCEPMFRERMELVKKATTSVAAVYAKDLFPLAVAVPPTEEQTVICSEVDRQISLADELEMEIDLRKSGSKALRQTLLRAAFRGELVDQDLNDEPASALLERIAAERVDSNTAAPTRGRRRKSA